MIDYVMEIFGTKRREPLTGHSIGRIFFTSPSEQEGVPGFLGKPVQNMSV